jgi:hypothetical protein
MLESLPTFRHLILLILSILFLCATAKAQQPFVTDDTDTTPKHHFHFEFSNELDVLQRASFPSTKQNTADFELDFGLSKDIEIGIESPYLMVFNAKNIAPARFSGIGDTNLSLKYNFLKEDAHSSKPALAIALNLELPTGNVSRQLGSGLADFYMNGILQKSITSKAKLRLNGGILFSGNETTGVIGIRTRGTVFTGAGSLVKQINPRLQLGIEVSGATTKNLNLAKGQLQTQFGGNYQLKNNISLDFGVIGGRFAASPRLGLQLGLSIDF